MKYIVGPPIIFYGPFLENGMFYSKADYRNRPRSVERPPYPQQCYWCGSWFTRPQDHSCGNN